MGIVNLKNETVVPLSYSNVFPWNNRAIVCRRNRWGIIDYTGNIIIPLKYEGLFSSGIDDFFIFKMNEKYGLIDRVGTILIPSIYDDIKATVQFDKKSWFAVCKENKWYYINRKEKLYSKYLTNKMCCKLKILDGWCDVKCKHYSFEVIEAL